MNLTIVAAEFLIIIGAIDLSLYMRFGYDQTITCFMRKSPLASFILGLIVGGLVIHLYFS